MDSGSGGLMMSGTGPFITTTTVTTILDFNPASMSRSMRSSGSSERNHYFSDKKFGSFSKNDIDVIVNSWNTLKRRGDFAPKVFIR